MRTANGGPRGGAQTPLPQSYTSAKDRRSPWLRKLRLLKQHRILSHPGGTQPPHPLPCPGTARLGHSVPDYCPPQEDRKLPSHRNTCEGGVPEDSGCGCGLDRGKPNFGLKFCSHGPRGINVKRPGHGTVRHRCPPHTSGAQATWDCDIRNWGGEAGGGGEGAGRGARVSGGLALFFPHDS